ncbi:unnamed protein product, partial [Rotaria socialis]
SATTFIILSYHNDIELITLPTSLERFAIKSSCRSDTTNSKWTLSSK